MVSESLPSRGPWLVPGLASTRLDYKEVGPLCTVWLLFLLARVPGEGGGPGSTRGAQIKIEPAYPNRWILKLMPFSLIGDGNETKHRLETMCFFKRFQAQLSLETSSSLSGYSV